MFEIVLFEPEIPPNTGNAIRLAANTGNRLHLVRPFGFVLNDKTLARAGMDYKDIAEVMIHDDWQAFLKTCPTARLYLFETTGTRQFTQANFEPGDALIFGPESRGLPDWLIESVAKEQRLKIPQVPNTRSLNLSNCVSIAAYEAWRQQGFEGSR